MVEIHDADDPRDREPKVVALQGQERARDEVRKRRERVLAHEDLAERLTQRPLCFARPDQWNGYVPPYHWRETPNTSPQRAALVDIAAEAYRREAEEGARAA